MPESKFIVITPARNEAKYIRKALASFVSQSVLPQVWLIVDDGSLDETATIAREAAWGHPWIKVIRRQDRGYRNLGYGDADAFYYGLSQVSADNVDYEFIFKIDADIVLGPDYFKTILKKFAHDPRLGIAAGEIDELYDDGPVRLRTLPLAKAGALKGWRRECFQQNQELIRGYGWDAIDSFKAMQRGWQVQTFPDEKLKVMHLRAMGSPGPGAAFRWLRHGRALHFAGAHPLWVLASACYHLPDRPPIRGALGIVIGYLQAVLRRETRYHDIEFLKYVRQWQKRKLLTILR
jgi:biofilm PGA synthesis N-glycosyltransferase PgaC